MNARFLFSVVTAAALAGTAGAQQQRRANIIGGGNGDTGRCYAEVRVDGGAEVQIQGDTATLRDISGQPPQWQRFDCTGPIPANANLRLNANGRGRTELVGTPRNGGPAVVRIQDPEGGAQVYQFELSWNNGGQGYQTNNRGPQPNYQGNPPAYAPDRRDDNWRDGQYRAGGRFTSDQAVQVCRDAIRQQAMQRYGTQDVNFRRINMDDEPGRNDWVVGMMEVRTRGGREERMRFSCSVNFDNGRVRSAQIDAPNVGSASRDIVAREMDTCRNAVSERIGENRVEFGRMNIEDRNGPDLVTGTARSRGRSFDFSCTVSPYSGNVRNVDVRRR
jgi:hypothetical protein